MKRSIKQKILLLVFVIVTLCVGSYIWMSVYYTKRSELAEIDQLLLAVAYGAQHVAGEDYHDSITGPESVSPELFKQTAKTLKNYAKQVRVKAIYAYMDYQGEFRWTADSDTTNTFFSQYDDDQQIVQDVYFSPLRDNEPEFFTYEDVYGSVRSAFIPFKTRTGVRYVIGVDFAFNHIQQLVSNIIRWYVLVGLAVLVVAFVIVGISVNFISKPLKNLVGFTNEMVNNDFHLAEQSLRQLHQLSSSFTNEVAQLSEAFLTMQFSLTQYIVDLRNSTAARESMEGQLRIARSIQMSMIPKGQQNLTERPEFDVCGTMVPAKEVGGDLYNYFMIDDRHLGFTVGDVSDKGIPAALFMAVTTTLIKAVARSGKSPAEVLSQVNNELCRDNEQCMFVTLFFGILDITNGKVCYANAGHNPFILVRNDQVEYRKLSSGMVLAAFEDYVFVDEELQLDPNDTIFMYTDGVTEAMNRSRELFGEKRLLESVVKSSQAGLNVMMEQTIADVAAFVNGNEQSDDITIFALRYFPGEPVKS
ncbi:MAG: PP2C family protein-serine/threonine phosphatase [Prolixibacteraceae bacterium]